jgi:molybdopterin synthase catalytic subunit
MANRVCDVLLTSELLNVAPEVADPRYGAVANFLGVVRGCENGREIIGIEYETHSTMAEHQMNEIAAAALDRFSLGRVVLHHRFGFVPVTEASLFVQVASGHRAAAFNALIWMVDELKKRVPIWKRPVYVQAPERQASLVT